MSEPTTEHQRLKWKREYRNGIGEKKRVPMGYILNCCTCAYVDQLLQDTSLHRDKSVSFIFQRLAVVVGRSSPAITQHAANIIACSLGFGVIQTTDKKFLNENEAMGVFSTIITHSVIEQGPGFDIECRGSKRLYSAICDYMVHAMRDIHFKAELQTFFRGFVKRIVGTFDAVAALSLINKLTASTRIRVFLLSIFNRSCDYTALKFGISTEGTVLAAIEYPDLYTALTRPNIQPSELIGIVHQYVDKECDHPLIGMPCEPLKLVQLIVQGHFHSQTSSDTYSELIQALAFVLYCKSRKLEKDPIPDMATEAVPTSGGRLCDAKYLQPVREAVESGNQIAITRRLELFGTELTEKPEALVEELKYCPVQTSLVTDASVANAFIYMVRTTFFMCTDPSKYPVDEEEMEFAKLGLPMRKKKVEDGEELMWNGPNFVKAINMYCEEMKGDEKVVVVPINWSIVVQSIDDQNLRVNQAVLRFLSDSFHVMFDSEPEKFPKEFIYNPWLHWKNQLFLFHSMLDYPGLLDLAQFPHTDVLIPEMELPAYPKKTEFVARFWNNMDITNLFITGVINDPTFMETFYQLYKVSMIQSFDCGMTAILTSDLPWCAPRQEVVRRMLPAFINQSRNAKLILKYCWNDETVQKEMRPQMMIAFGWMYGEKVATVEKILELMSEMSPTAISEFIEMPTKTADFLVDFAFTALSRDQIELDVTNWLEMFEETNGKKHIVKAVLVYLQKYEKEQLMEKMGGDGPIGQMMRFVEGRATDEEETAFKEIFEVMRENSGRSSSVSSTGGRNSTAPAVFGGGVPPPGTPAQQAANAQQLPITSTISAAGPATSTAPAATSQQSTPTAAPTQVPLPQPIGPPSSQQQQHPGPIQPPAAQGPGVIQPPVRQYQPGPIGPPSFGQGAANQAHMMQNFQQTPGNMNLLMGMSAFGAGSRDLLKVVQPAPPQPPSMSPSSQMMRSQIPPLAQRQNSSSGWHAAPGPAPRQSGPGTPHHMDFRNMQPNQVQDFVPQRNMLNNQMGNNQPNMQQQQQHQQLNNHNNMDDVSNMTFSEDIQEEANSYFEKIYSGNGPMPVNDLISLMKQFKNSPNPRERTVLACVVKNLFEEYRFFHEYPERELRTTAEVYGGIIREGIIGNVQFAAAVRKVIESLSADTNSMLWTFGIVALQHCRTKLCAYPKVCQMISTNENFSKFPQNLKDYVLSGCKGELPPNAGRNTPTSSTNWGAVARAASVDPKTSLPANRQGNVLSFTNVETLVVATEKDGAEIAQPAEAIVDKISFLFNNLSQNNLMQKKDEVIEMMKEHGEGFTRWLSQYIVMKRVSIEQNFQPLYNQFVTAIESPYLDACIKKETFRNIKILLRTDKKTTVASNYSDRQLLKNLGMWLGSITIARNRPILLNELDLKSLLLEAYYKGQAELLFVVPFISKILMSCSKTNLFTPSCAWIRSILRVLAELHNEPDLKINLKFEIEVLCKELNVDLTQLPLDDILKDTEKLVRVPQQLCEVKVLSRPDVPSPVPSQIRLSGSAEQLSGMSPVVLDAKPSTPQPDGEMGGAGAGNNEQVTPNVTHFAYHDINVLTYDGLIPHVKIQTHLPLFQLHPHAKHLVRPAMIHAIKELIGPVTERALKIAVTVTESMVRKDFGMDPDEKAMKLAAFHMMRAMTAGMAMITCRDPLASTMISNFANAFQSSLRSSGGNPELKAMIEEAAQTITQDNVELATNFIVKTACEKASQEIEKRMESDYQRRAQAKLEDEPFREEAVYAMQAKLPRQIQIQAGGVDKSQLGVYEQFSARICGFKAASDDTVPNVEAAPIQPMPPIPTAQMKDLEPMFVQFANVIKEVDQTTQAQPHVTNAAFQTVCMIRELLNNVVTTKDANGCSALVTRSVEHLLHSYHLDAAPSKNILDVEWARRLRDLFIGVMRLLQTFFSIGELSRRVTTAIMTIRSDYKWNMEGIEILFKQNLLNSNLWDQHLSHCMDNGSNMEATVFAQKFVRHVGTGDPGRVQFLKEKFPLTFEQLSKIHQIQSATRQHQEPNGQQAQVSQAQAQANQQVAQAQAIAQAQAQMAAAAAQHHADQQAAIAEGQQQGGQQPNGQRPDGVPQQRGFDDQEMTTKVELILREWIQLCYSPTGQRNPQESLAQMIQLMHENGVLATDEKITQFFRLCVEMCVDVSVRMMKTELMSGVSQSFVRHRCYYTLDAFVKLMALMIRHSDNGQSQNKINLLKKLLNIVVGVLHMDHEVRKNEFNSMPYHRILISLFNEVTGPDPQKLLEPIAWSILEAFGQTFFALQPRRMPGFAFAWLDLVGHRNVIGRLLANTGIAETVDPVKTAATYTQLIISHLKFLAPFLRNIQLPKSIAILYKGTLRVLLVILHDFPELLCEFHYVICDTIPPNCVQLRNLILSAYPRNMRLPDPFALNFKQVDTIPEMSIEPKSNLNMATIIPDNIRIPLDEYLSNRESVEFLTSLPALLITNTHPGCKYNTTVMNALVLYVGIRAIESLHTRRQRISTMTIAHTSYMDIFQNLAVQLCTEGRYLLFNGIANQLRYPNAHTHYFSCVFLFLFRNSDHPAIQEQITRILFERLVALRPHPWGLLITFIELIKNPQYQFWKYEFTRCAPEIERLFQNVANTCVPTQAMTQAAAAAAAAQAAAQAAATVGTPSAPANSATSVQSSQSAIGPPGPLENRN